ncbi:ABC transporter ATP-binding protein [Brevibacillus sp. NRS-1366]|uniref:ABC transporter ATP-binding protein n=1 Tax=Brevibacillus sp. NRS-1366 TaxID=3233899 RepID=UPI003D1A3385
MNQTPLAPMGVGKLLDRSFSVYRQHFAAFFLLALIWFGPFLLLQQFLMVDIGSMPLLMQDTDGLDFWESMGNRFMGQEELMTDNMALLVTYIVIVIPLMTFVAYPQMISVATILTEGAIKGKQLRLKDAMKQALGRFWPLVGSTVVYGLVALGVMIGFVLACMLLFFLLTVAFGGSFDTFLGLGNDVNPIFLMLLFIVGNIVFIIGTMLVPGFFLLRWSFYLPLVLFEQNGVGLAESWRLTKGNFWRLLAIFFVLSVLYSIFSGGVQALTTGTMGMSIVAQLILVLLACLLMPWMSIVYALTYFDLVVRKEGTDLQVMLNNQMTQDQATVVPNEQEAPHE